MIYDAAIVGGGLAGATLARALALGGARVVVFEREAEFRDRVRGDMVYPWGAAELRRLGLYELVRERAAVEIPTWASTIAPLPTNERHFPSTTPSGLPALGFFHPKLQELLLEAAANAGAEVWRPARVVGVAKGSADAPASVTVERRNEEPQAVRARLLVGADGRGSRVRALGGFEAVRDADRLVLAGASVTGSSAPRDAAHMFMVPARGTVSILIPTGEGRHRVYAGYELRGGRRQLSGPAAFDSFVALAAGSGMPLAWLSGARLAGPLAAFDGADNWVESPFSDGVALIGDAAATSDPSFGCGVSLALRDARVLAEALLQSGDWEGGARAYAVEHDTYFGALHRRIDWLTQVLRKTGPQADSIRRRALPMFANDPSRVPDVVGQGPDGPSDEAARRRFFGEE